EPARGSPRPFHAAHLVELLAQGVYSRLAAVAKDLRTFVEQVEERYPEDYLRVSREVDPSFELTGVLRRLQADGCFPTVLFESVRGMDVPVLGNALANRERLAL